MSFPLQIAFRNLEASASAEALVRQQAADLEQVSDHIRGCRVVLDCVHRQNATGRLYKVHIELSVPGRSILATRGDGNDHAHDDLSTAIRDSFDAARRKLQAHKFLPIERLRPPRGYGRSPGNGVDETG